MPPRIPTNCDACGKRLFSPLLCSRCKGHAFCSEACRFADWEYSHKRGCSILPEGELVPARVERSAERAEEVAKATRLLRLVQDASDSLRWGGHNSAMGDTPEFYHLSNYHVGEIE